VKLNRKQWKYSNLRNRKKITEKKMNSLKDLRDSYRNIGPVRVSREEKRGQH
jgi:hypothetical protein